MTFPDLQLGGEFSAAVLDGIERAHAEAQEQGDLTLENASPTLVHRVATAATYPLEDLKKTAEMVVKAKALSRQVSVSKEFTRVATFLESGSNFKNLSLHDPKIQQLIDQVGEDTFIEALEKIAYAINDINIVIARPAKILIDYFNSSCTVPFDRFPHVETSKPTGSQGFLLPEKMTWRDFEQTTPINSTQGGLKVRVPIDAVDSLYSFMKETVPGEYGTDGCDPRCKWSAYFMQNVLGLEVGMIKISRTDGQNFDQNGEFPPVQTEWRMHTAAYVVAEDGSKYVIDYALKRPVPIEEWKAMLYPAYKEHDDSVAEISGCEREVIGQGEISHDNEARDIHALYLFENIDGNDAKVLKRGWRDRKPVHPELQFLYDQIAKLGPDDHVRKRELQGQVSSAIARIGESDDSLVLTTDHSDQEDPILLDGKVPVVTIISRKKIKVRFVDAGDEKLLNFDPTTRCYYLNTDMLEKAQRFPDVQQLVTIEIAKHTASVES